MPGTALLEIDFQGWIVALVDDPAVVTRAERVRVAQRARGAHLFCLRYLDADGGERSDPRSAEARFIPALAPPADALVLSKSGRDAFDDPDLETNLRIRGVAHVVLTGLLTVHGVLHAARSAHRLGFEVTVIADACRSDTAANHDAGLRALTSLGAHVR